MTIGSYRQRVGGLRRRALPLAAGVVVPSLGLVAVNLPPAAAATAAGPGVAPTVDYIVEGTSLAAVERAVEAAGGRIVAGLPLIGGVEARLAPGVARTLAATPGLAVTPDVALEALGSSYGAGDTRAPAGSSRSSTAGTAPVPAQLARMHLGDTWSPTAGSGVGVAVIDTGLAPTAGISESRIVRSPDFSGDAGKPGDGYGHGTFMAGLIAGSGVGGAVGVPGVAPGATVVAVKVARSDGSTSVSRLIEGIGWAVAHRDRYDIRVMSISFGARLGAPSSLNPLDAAVEAAWAAGIVVVAAAGNLGAGQVTSPGDDPWVITAGAETTTGAYASPSWSSYSAIKPDVLSPGTSVESLRDPGSYIDRTYPQARRGGLYFVGSGTSMATALTAGAAALLIHDHPDATPDDVKAALTSSEGPPVIGHAGPIDVAAADGATASPSWWQHPAAATTTSARQVMPWAGRPWTPSTWEATGGSPSWAAVTWPHPTWETMTWETMTWETMTWETMTWETMTWEAEGW